MNPCQNQAQCVDKFNGFDCVCAVGWTGDSCEEDLDECVSDPCTNGGQCQNTLGAFRCDCPEHYYGLTCDIIGSCINSPCLNGTCAQDEIDKNVHVCNCDYGYEGDACESIVDFCANQPCGPGGTCEQTPGTTEWKCTCLAGYTGNLCQEDINECLDDPCKNGGRCIDRVAAFECDCTATGYQGQTCQEDLNECEAIDQTYCIQGKCTNTQGSYTCDCNYPYIGRRCAHVNPCLVDASNSTKYSSIPNVIVESHQCLNEARCDEASVTQLNTNEKVEYKCKCVDGYEGDTCALRSKEASALAVPLSYIVGPLLGIILLLCLIGCVAFVLVARQKRATRGTYSPSRQEMSGARLHMAYMMKAPPQEGLI